MIDLDNASDLNLPCIERVVGKHTYKATIMPLVDWYRLEGLCMKAFGDPLEKLLGAIPLDAVNLDEGTISLESLNSSDILANLAEVLHGILRGLGPEELSMLVETMAGNVEVRVPGKPWEPMDMSVIHEWFRRYMSELIPVLFLHLEVQFRDFFGGALSLFEGLTLVKSSKNVSKKVSKKSQKSRSRKG